MEILLAKRIIMLSKKEWGDGGGNNVQIISNSGIHLLLQHYHMVYLLIQYKRFVLRFFENVKHTYKQSSVFNQTISC